MMHQESMDIMFNFIRGLTPKLSFPVAVLDVGSKKIGENKTYRELFPARNFIYTGLDVEPGNNVDIVVKDPYDWNLSKKFDLIVSGQAFEHIEYPWLTINEIAKALIIGGYAILINPTTPIIHRFPVDCWRILPDGWIALAKWAKLGVITSSMNNFGTWQDSFCLLRKL